MRTKETPREDLIKKLQLALDICEAATKHELLQSLDCEIDDAIECLSETIETQTHLLEGSDEPRSWVVTIDAEQDGATEIVATSCADALNQAAEWTREGDWELAAADAEVTVDVRCMVTGEHDRDQVFVGDLSEQYQVTRNER